MLREAAGSEIGHRAARSETALSRPPAGTRPPCTRRRTDGTRAGGAETRAAAAVHARAPGGIHRAHVLAGRTTVEAVEVNKLVLGVLLHEHGDYMAADKAASSCSEMSTVAGRPGTRGVGAARSRWALKGDRFLKSEQRAHAHRRHAAHSCTCARARHTCEEDVFRLVITAQTRTRRRTRTRHVAKASAPTSAAKHGHDRTRPSPGGPARAQRCRASAASRTSAASRRAAPARAAVPHFRPLSRTHASPATIVGREKETDPDGVVSRVSSNLTQTALKAPLQSPSHESMRLSKCKRNTKLVAESSAAAAQRPPGQRGGRDGSHLRVPHPDAHDGMGARPPPAHPLPCARARSRAGSPSRGVMHECNAGVLCECAARQPMHCAPVPVPPVLPRLIAHVLCARACAHCRRWTSTRSRNST